MNQPCNCEHARHPLPKPTDPTLLSAWEWAQGEYPQIPRDGHVYMAVPAGSQRAQYVGPICDWCATHCLYEYLI